jgi:hypothetical protein
MPKVKKCTVCNKPYHQCGHAPNCKCIKRNCCLCPPSSSSVQEQKEVFPRPCPCKEVQCQKVWKEATATEKADDDTDFIVFHCKCHDIALGKTSSHCEECGEWVCQNCDSDATFDLDLDSDEELDGTYCKKCRIPIYRAIAANTRDKIQRLEKRQKAVSDAL